MKSLSKVAIVVFTIISSYTSYSQCYTTKHTNDYSNIPWRGNNKMLDDFRNELNEQRNLLKNGRSADFELSGILCNILEYVPIRIIVWYDNNSNDAITNQKIDDLLEDANRRFEETNAEIQFFLNEPPQFIYDEYYANGENIQGNPVNSEALFQDHEDDIITVHLVGNINGGYANTPWDLTLFPYVKSCWVGTQRIDDNPTQANVERNAGTLAHELGHVLGLFHTHHPGENLAQLLDPDGDNAQCNDCWQEFVSRTAKNDGGIFCPNDDEISCEVSGDFCVTQMQILA